MKNLELIPVNTPNGKVYMTQAEVAKLNGLGWWWISRRRKREAESKAKETQKKVLEQRNLLTSSIDELKSRIPNYQKELQNYQNQINQEVRRIQEKGINLPFGLAIAGAVLGTTAFAYTIYQKIKKK